MSSTEPGKKQPAGTMQSDITASARNNRAIRMLDMIKRSGFKEYLKYGALPGVYLPDLCLRLAYLVS